MEAQHTRTDLPHAPRDFSHMNGGNRPVEIYNDEEQLQDTSSRRARRPTKLRSPSPARTRSKGPVGEESDPAGGAKKAGGDDEGQDKRTGGEVDPAPGEDDDFFQDTPHVRIMVNRAEVDNWDRCNEQLFNISYLTTTGPASSYLPRYEPKGLAKPNGKMAWEALIAKYENSSKQRRRILIRQLDNLKMSPGQDPDEFLTKVLNFVISLSTWGNLSPTIG